MNDHPSDRPAPAGDPAPPVVTGAGHFPTPGADGRAPAPAGTPTAPQATAPDAPAGAAPPHPGAPAGGTTHDDDAEQAAYEEHLAGDGAP